MVWVLNGKSLEPRFVRTGLTNGRVTEILGGNLHEGDTIIVGKNDSSQRTQTQTGSPFGQRPGGMPGGGMPGGGMGDMDF